MVSTAVARLRALVLLCVAVPSAVLAQKPASRDLTDASLEDLMNMEVTSVSKKEQKLSKTGAAVFVITQEDIRRSGANNIPDLLRMVPGADVAQIDANKWAISLRGFNDRYADKVLVLIDGRSVYTPSFSGVYWDQQDVPLDNIERIEVIRGPGGTVWGANAMNGVINIITKSAKATQGGLLSAGSGSEDIARGMAQYGGRIGQNGAYRVFGEGFKIASSESPNGQEAADGWRMAHGGFRTDWDLSPRDTLMVQGDVYQTGESQTITSLIASALPVPRTFNEQFNANGADVVARWNRTLANGASLSLQMYYDRSDRREQGGGDTLNTVDFDFQHHLTVGSRHDVVWGAGYRVVKDSITAGYATTFVPLDQTASLFSTFVQDEIRLTNAVWLTVGSKFEHNAYTGFEYEPSARLVWTPTDRQAFWLSASRAIRQPDRADFGLRSEAATFPLPGGAFGVVELLGNSNTKAEQLHDYEAGYRAQVSKRLSLDIASYASFYRRLLTNEPGAPFFTAAPTPLLISPLYFDNRAHAFSYGVEVFANWNVTPRWRISPGYGAIHMEVNPDPDSGDTNVAMIPGNTPAQQFQIRSFLNLTRRLDWDISLFRTGALNGAAPTPGYTRLDTRLGWRLAESVDLSVGGQNLLLGTHAEFHDQNGLNHILLERRFVAKITWRF
jgi:iron complex outermembrane receptor protein